MHYTIQPIILCGGNGSRLWPLSKAKLPKQFIEIEDGKTMLECTIDRISSLQQNLATKTCFDLGTKSYTVKMPLLVMHKSHSLPSSLSAYQKNVIYEEYSNDTGVAITRAILHMVAIGDQADIVIVLPSDHYISNNETYIYDMISGIDLVQEDNIVLFGIEPTSPNTQYGYMIPRETGVWFREKPDEHTALELIKQRAMWNSGIFTCRFNHLHQCLTANDNIMWYVHNLREGKADSFDVAVLQQHRKLVAHYCLQWGWNDVGTWQSFLSLPKIQQEIGGSTVIMTECQNVNVLNRTSGKVVVIGCKDLLIVSHGNDILVMPSNGDYSTQLKDITSDML